MKMFTNKIIDSVELKYGKGLSAENRLSGKYDVYSSAGVCGKSDLFLAENGICIGRKGTAGSVYFSKTPFFTIDTAFYIDSTKKGYDLEYMYYILKSMNLKHFVSDAAVPGLNRNLVHKLKFSHHNYETQKRIASILSSFDNKIELNLRKITSLEKITEQIYKEWFVRFRFPGYKNSIFKAGFPVDWSISKVEKIVKRLPFNQTYKANELSYEGKVIVVDQSLNEYIGFHDNAPSHKANIQKPLLLFGDHSCKFQLMTSDFSLGENVIPFCSKDSKTTNDYYLFFSVYKLVNTEEYKRHWSMLKSKKIILPNIELQNKFGNIVSEIIQLKEQLTKINKNLEKQRDLLLPRLLSGKIEVLYNS